MEVRSSAKSPSLLHRIRCWFDARAARDAARIEALEAECARLRERLHECDERGKARGEALYELQQHYSTEHFELQESMRNLKIERLRNAGMFGDRDILISRANKLQSRIRSLKSRLLKYEAVEDEHFDEAPIVRENPGPDPGAAEPG